MAYCLFRLFKEAASDEHRVDRLRTELIPKLRDVPGFQRFASFYTADGRYGGFQVYDSKNAMDRAVQMLDEWRRHSGMNEPASIEQRGETGLTIVVKPAYEQGYGVVRIYRTDAAFDQVNQVIEQEAGETIRTMPGLFRYTTVRFDDGRIAVLAACDSEESCRNLGSKADAMRARPGSRLGQALPNDPEVIIGKIMLFVAK